jgi:predicted ATPase
MKETDSVPAEFTEDTTVSDATRKSRVHSGNYRSLLSKARTTWLKRQLAANRKRRCRIVLTGGPGGGKTTAADLFRREIGERVVIVPESATLLFLGGFPRSKHPQAAAAAQQAIFHVQRQLEDVQSFLYTDRVLLCDRGTVDGAAYCPESPDKFFTSLGTSFEAELARYDGVIFFESAAVGGLTIEGGNPIRNETVEQAVALDGRLRELWMHHPRFVLVRHDASFFKKIALGLAELDSMVNEYADDREKEIIRQNARNGT